MNISLLLSILDEYGLTGCVTVDLSKRNVQAGMIGLTICRNKYEVYEVNEMGLVKVILSTPDEETACKEVLACVGISM